MKKQGRSVQEIIDGFPPKRQKHIRERAKKDIEAYKSLQEFRKRLGITQKQLAESQGIRQVNISRLEGKSDMKLSTLRKYVESLGCELELWIKMPENNSKAKIDV
jgi:transcriptional regulator with XRE-family HTH domain